MRQGRLAQVGMNGVVLARACWYDIVVHTLVPKDRWHSGSAPSPV